MNRGARLPRGKGRQPHPPYFQTPRARANSTSAPSPINLAAQPWCAATLNFFAGTLVCSQGAHRASPLEAAIVSHVSGKGQSDHTSHISNSLRRSLRFNCDQNSKENWERSHEPHLQRGSLYQARILPGRDLGECHDDVFCNRAADGVRATANGPLSLPGRHLL